MDAPRAIDIDLGEQRESSRQIEVSQKLLICASLPALVPRTGCREAQDGEAAILELPMQVLQPLILGCEAALTGNVNHQQDAPL